MDDGAMSARKHILAPRALDVEAGCARDIRAQARCWGDRSLLAFKALGLGFGVCGLGFGVWWGLGLRA